jgi:hypothetical protein
MDELNPRPDWKIYIYLMQVIDVSVKQTCLYDQYAVGIIHTFSCVLLTFCLFKRCSVVSSGLGLGKACKQIMLSTLCDSSGKQWHAPQRQ